MTVFFLKDPFSNYNECLFNPFYGHYPLIFPYFSFKFKLSLKMINIKLMKLKIFSD